MADLQRDDPAARETEQHFWRQVAAVTEGEIDPPADGWQRIAKQLEAERRPSEIDPPAPPRSGLRLPGALIWFVGLFALITLFVIAAHTRPVPLDTTPLRVEPLTTPPVDTTTRQMRIGYEGAVSVSLRDTRMRLDYRITNIGTGPITIPGPGGPTSASPHYLLDVRQADKQLLQVHLVAESADLRLANGKMPSIADPSLDLTLAPGDSVIAHVNSEVAGTFPRGVGLYQVSVRYLPPGLSDQSSPADTISPPIDVRVGK